MDRDDLVTLATEVLGGLGAVAEALGLRGGAATLYAGLAMPLASAVMLALLLMPAKKAVRWRRSSGEG
ncbi:MAG: hypothetical protein RXP86_10145 [Acidilobus sp.]|jgi:hypothetical protein